MLAANTDPEILTLLASAFNCHLDQLAYPLAIQHFKRVVLQDSHLYILRQKFILSIFARK